MDKKSWVTVVSIILAVILAGTALWFAMTYDSGVAKAMETVETRITELNQTLVDYYTEQLEQLQQQYNVSLRQSNESLTQLNFQYNLLLGNYSTLIENYNSMVEIQQRLTVEVNALMETIEKELNTTVPTWKHVANFTLSTDGTVISQQFYVNTSNWRIKWKVTENATTTSNKYGVPSFVISEENTTIELVEFINIFEGVYYPRLPQKFYALSIVNVGGDGMNFTIEQFV